MRDVCDVAYVLQLDLLERRTAVMVGVAAQFRASGGDVDIPSFDEERAKFDAALVDEPRPLSDSESLLCVLGVA